MSQKAKVLISAYACEPGKGSEPEVGWQWVLQMARYYDVTVLTRENNRDGIEAGIKLLRGRQPLPKCVSHDREPFLLTLKKRMKAVKIYYILWQKSARAVIAQLHKVHRYDLMHHVTFAGFRYPIAIWGHGVPCIWGPIGGIESIPRALLPWHHPRSLMNEVLRNLNNLLQSMPFHVLPKRAQASTVILASTPEMRTTFALLGFQTQLEPAIGLHTTDFPCLPRSRKPGALWMLFVGNIITLKGIDLALEAMQRAGGASHLTLIGDGNYQAAAESKVEKLGLSDRVTFLGRMPRAEVLQAYPNYDLFLFPSLHDTGGYAVLEAMLNGLPVICLDCGGPGIAVKENCGKKVPLGGRDAVVTGIAEAIRFYESHPEELTRQGDAARRTIQAGYDWEGKGKRMHGIYEEAMALGKVPRSRSQKSSYSGMGGFANIMHRLFSLKGVAAGVLVMLLIGAMGFLSISYLKDDARQIVRDTLPGLSSAGEANASLAQAFNRTLLLLMTEDHAERENFRREIDAYSHYTENILNEYSTHELGPGEAALFSEVIETRRKYLEIRTVTVSLMESTNHAQAVVHSQKELLPAYSKYKKAADALFNYNLQESRARGDSIMRMCTTTQFAAAAILMLVFVAGFFMGLFK